MSDQRIQYTEELVGANHPTKSDTINRLALMETDTDGHGKLRYLKERSATPATSSGEGVLYTMANGDQTCLYYRANGSSTLLARPTSPSFAARGFITGLQSKSHDTTQIKIASGSVEINGGLYHLPEDILFTPGAPSASSLFWRALCVRAPSSGDELSASNFSTVYTTVDGASRITWTGSGWYLTDNANLRVIGFYPIYNESVGVYYTADGAYWLGSSLAAAVVLDTASPPIVNTSINVGLPVMGDYIRGIYRATIRNDTGPGVALTVNSLNVLSGLVGNASGLTLTGHVSLFSNTGEATMAVSNWGTSGTINWLRLWLAGVCIPRAMAH